MAGVGIAPLNNSSRFAKSSLMISVTPGGHCHSVG
jgi:hypothetical protein